MAVHSVAKQRGENQIAATALQNAQDLESSCSAGSCSSVLYGESDATTASESCSESCSTCFSDSGSVSGSDYSDHEIRGKHSKFLFRYFLYCFIFFFSHISGCLCFPPRET